MRTLLLLYFLAACLLCLDNTVMSYMTLPVSRSQERHRGRDCPSRRRPLLFATPSPSSTDTIRTTVTIAENRQAGGEYEIEERYEAGVALFGSEVKSCRKGGGVQLSDGMAEIRQGEAWLLNVHIAEHSRCSRLDQHKPKRIRKLLLHHKEILKLEQRVQQRNLEIIPLRLYFNEKNCIKVELGLGKKKSLNDKRDDLVKRDGEREVRRVMKGGSFD